MSPEEEQMQQKEALEELQDEMEEEAGPACDAGFGPNPCDFLLDVLTNYHFLHIR